MALLDLNQSVTYMNNIPKFTQCHVWGPRKRKLSHVAGEDALWQPKLRFQDRTLFFLRITRLYIPQDRSILTHAWGSLIYNSDFTNFARYGQKWTHFKSLDFTKLLPVTRIRFHSSQFVTRNLRGFYTRCKRTKLHYRETQKVHLYLQHTGRIFCHFTKHDSCHSLFRRTLDFVLNLPHSGEK
jgi:hypothetical protein